MSRISKYVVEQKAHFSEAVDVEDDKKVTIGSDNAFKIVQVSSDSSSSITIGDSETADAKHVVIDRSFLRVEAASGVNELKDQNLILEGSRTKLSSVPATGLVLQDSTHDSVSETTAIRLGGTDEKDMLFAHGNSTLSIVHKDNNSAAVGDKTSAAELRFDSGDSGHSGFIPILNSNHQIPVEYLSSTFSFDGKLKFRNFIALKWQEEDVGASLPAEWILDTSVMPSAENWYTGAKDALEPGTSDASPGDDKYWNFAFATGSYFLVVFDGTLAPDSEKPYHVGLETLFSMLASGGYLDDKFGGDTWYTPNTALTHEFAAFSQGNYEVSNSDMIVIRNAQPSYGTATDTPVEVTVIDNSDEFQKRLVEETHVQFPIAGATPTMDIDSTSVTLRTSGNVDMKSSAGQTLVESEHKLAAAVSVIASGADPATTLFLESKGTGASAVDIDSSGGVDVDAAGQISLESASAAVESVLLKASSADGSVKIASDGTAEQAIDMYSSSGGINAYANNKILLTSNNATGVGSAVELRAANGEVLINATSSANADAIKLDASYAGGINAVAKKSIVLNSTSTASDAINIDSSGGVDVDAAKMINLTSTSADASSLYLLASDTGASSGIQLEAKGSSSSAINIDSAGGVDVDAQGAIDLASAAASASAIKLSTSSTASTIQIASSGTSAEALKATSAGGIQLLATGGNSKLSSENSAAEAVYLLASGEDAATTMKLESKGSGNSAVQVDSLGGVDIDAVAEINIASSAGDMKLTAPANKTITATAPTTKLVSAAVDVGTTSNGVMKTTDKTCISLNGRKTLAQYSNATDIFRLQLDMSANSDDMDRMMMLKVTLSASDGQTTGVKAQAMARLNVVYRYNCSASTASATATVENYYINGPINAYVFCDAANGSLWIFGYFTGNEGTEFYTGCNWVGCVESEHNFSDSSATQTASRFTVAAAENVTATEAVALASITDYEAGGSLLN